MKHWNEGKDFVINNPTMQTFCSVRDGDELPVGSKLQLRYRKKTMVGVITKQADGTWTGTFDDDETPEEKSER